MKIKNKKDFGLGIGTILVSTWIIWETMKLPAPEYEGDPGPKMFPMIGGVLMLICGLVLLVRQDAPGGAFLSPAQWKAAGKIFGVYILALILMWVFGWTLSVPIVLFILTYMMSKLSMPDASRKKRIISSLIWAVLAGLGIYLAYKVGLKARLPRGLMYNWFKWWNF
jgi:hypothetical protein